MPPKSNRKKNKGKGKKADSNTTAPPQSTKNNTNKSKNTTVAFYKCAGCDNLGADFKVCSKCKMAKYCSASCQKEHWPEHKKACGVLSLNYLGLGKPKLRFKVGGKSGDVLFLWCIIYMINCLLLFTSDNILHAFTFIR